MIKRLILIACGVCLLLNMAEAKPRRPEKPIDWKSELDLSVAQKAQVDEIYAQSRDKVKSLIQQIDSLHQEIAETRESDDLKIRTLLNEKQQIKFDKIKARIQKSQGGEEREKGEKKPSRKRMRQY